MKRMRVLARMGRERTAITVLALGALLIGCASSASGVKGRAGEARREARRAVRAVAPPPRDGAIRDALESAGAEAVAALAHVAVLSDPFLEGRAPDTEGNRIASEYIEFHFRRMGLRPAFEQRDGGERVASGSGAGGSSYRQAFTVKGGTELIEGSLVANGPGGEETFRLGSEFHPLGFSGNGRVSGEVAFAGYSIVDGPQGYTSYREEDDLSGKVVMVLRYEPLDEDGQSRWGRNGEWSDYASLPAKMQAAEERGAAAVLLVNPPGADDPRAEFLETHQSSLTDAGVTIPVVHMSPAAADRLIDVVCGGAGCAGLLELREAADGGGSGAGAEPVGSGTVSLAVELERDRVPTSNVGALLPGRGALAEEMVVIGAHYDHLGYGHFGARDPQNAGQIHPGADDNASGVAAMLLAAGRLKEAYDEAEEGSLRSVLFLAFSGEEMGLLGSSHFASATALEADRVTAMLNLDMVGRVRQGEVVVNGVGTSESWRDIVLRAAEEAGLHVDLNKAGIGPSDHTIFYQSDIPVLHFFSGTHGDYHTVADTFEKLNYIGIARVAQLVAGIARDLATQRDRLAFTSTGDAGVARGGRTKAKVRLGIMPASYAPSEEGGVEVGEVFEGTSAAEAGFRKGDRLVRWGGQVLADVNAMVQKLAEARPGDEVDMVVIREGREVVLHVVLHAKAGTK